MSTRSCIARAQADGWAGVYHHSDGYPSGLGCYLFRLIRREHHGDVEAFLKWAIDEHDGGWSHIFPSEYRPDGQGKARKPQPVCYCHGYFARRDGTKPGDKRGVITWQDADPLFIEWVYVFDAPSRTLTILGHARVLELRPGQKGTHCEAWELQELDGKIKSFPACYYVHVPKAVGISLDGPEPDWLEIEREDFSQEHLERRETWVDSFFPPEKEASHAG